MKKVNMENFYIFAKLSLKEVGKIDCVVESVLIGLRLNNLIFVR